MSETNSRIGKSVPVDGNGARNNHAPVSQSSATVYGDRVGWILALVVGVLALALALFVAFTLWRVSQDLQHRLPRTEDHRLRRRTPERRCDLLGQSGAGGVICFEFRRARRVFAECAGAE